MVEAVLSVTGPVIEPSQNLYKIRVQSVDTDFQNDSLTFAPDLGLHFLLGLLETVLDAGRMNASVLDQFFKCDPGDLPPHRIEAGNRYRFRSIVDYQVSACSALDRPDVPSLTAYDPALHLIVRKSNDRYGSL